VIVYDFSGLPCIGPEPENPGSGALNHDTGFVWTQAALADPGMLASILLVSCRSLSNAQNRQDWDLFAIGYKVEALKDIQRSIAREGSSVSEVTLTKTLALASEEVCSSRTSSQYSLRLTNIRKLFSGNSQAADHHLRAAVHMVRLRNSPHRLAMWKHSKNQQLWTHTEELLEDGTSIVLHYYHEPAYCVNPNPDPRVTHVHTAE
jgi:transcription factor-like protein